MWFQPWVGRQQIGRLLGFGWNVVGLEGEGERLYELNTASNDLIIILSFLATVTSNIIDSSCEPADRNQLPTMFICLIISSLTSNLLRAVNASNLATIYYSIYEMNSLSLAYHSSET
jgi:hypothetical protein